jgi:hypothetical protein
MIVASSEGKDAMIIEEMPLGLARKLNFCRILHGGLNRIDNTLNHS